jgi:Mn-dependent DtxR family transcriptional regulator
VNDNQKPMFVEFIANNLWKIYEVSENKDTETLTKMSKALGIEVSTTA